MIELDVDLLGFKPGELAAVAEQQIDELMANTAHELEKALRKQTGNEWPVDTSFSIRRFRAEDDSQSRDIIITNTAPYAARVNNTRTFGSGRPNPNYQALQRQVLKVWQRVVAEVLRG